MYLIFLTFVVVYPWRFTLTAGETVFFFWERVSATMCKSRRVLYYFGNNIKVGRGTFC